MPRLCHPENAATAWVVGFASSETRITGRRSGFAELATVDRSYIAGIEVGARNPSLKAIERLADAFDVPIAALFNEL